MTLRNYLVLTLLCFSSLFAAENIKAVGAVAKANIKAIGAVEEANIKAVGPVDNTASGGGGVLSDDFTGDGDISGRSGTGFTWAELAGSMDTSGGQLRSITAGFAKNMAIADTSIGADDGYAVFTYVTTTAFTFIHIIARYTDASSPYYGFEMNAGDGDWAWYKYDNAADSSGTQIGAGVNLVHAANDKWGITWTGTGAGTTIRIWKNFTSNVPISASEWDSGDTTPDGSWTDDPGVDAVDSGQKTGIQCFQQTANVAIADNFFADGF